MTCRPCAVSSIMSRIASNTFGSPSALMMCSSERNRKCSDITPACGEIVAVLAEETMAKSISPDLHQLQELRLLPELRAGILVDQHGALAQFLELGGKDIVGDAVAGIELLIVGEAIVLHLLRAGAGGEHNRRRGDHRTDEFPWILHNAVSPCLIFSIIPSRSAGLSIKHRQLSNSGSFQAPLP